MVLLAGQDSCTGCAACSAVCPVQAVRMEQDTENGFYRPVLNEALCVECKKCESVCPQLSEPITEKKSEKKVYAAICKNEKIRNASASGGLFAVLAGEIIKRGGCAAGVAYDKKMRVVHQLAENEGALSLLYGSKYAQSDMRFIYHRIFQRLEDGKEVLFCGTPCQVAGVKKAVEEKKLEGKLITVDLLCRGVPSPKALQKYLEMIEKQNAKRIVQIKFKDNENGWHNVNTKIVMEDGSECYLPVDQCTYVGGFLDDDITVRESCFSCIYKTTERQGDITIGDFWGLRNTGLVDDKGTSAVILNSEKGYRLWDDVKHILEYKESTMWRVVRGNPMAFKKLKKNPARKVFWKYLKQYDYDSALQKAREMKKEMKKLGFGMARLPLLDKSDQSTIDIKSACKMVDAFLERGFTYFDTAWMYHEFQSENAVREILTNRYPRDNFRLATKLPPSVKTKEERDQIFHEQMRKTGVDFFDAYLLHNVNTYSYEVYEKLDCFQWMKDKKEQGLVKKIGFSFHGSAELLEKILQEYPEMEFVQLQINYLDWESENIQSRMCYETAEKYGKPVIVMEPVKGGTLANVPENAKAVLRKYHPDWSEASWAIRFAAGLDHVALVLSGMSSMEQVADNTDCIMDSQPFGKAELDAVRKAAEMINSNIAIPCTGCFYCTANCPEHIAIPEYFSLYNSYRQEMEGKYGTPYEDYYNSLGKTSGKAGDCVQCGQCEKICPQHLPVRELLRTITDCFEKRPRKE